MRPANRRVLYLYLLALPIFAFVAHCGRFYLPAAVSVAGLGVAHRAPPEPRGEIGTQSLARLQAPAPFQVSSESVAMLRRPKTPARSMVPIITRAPDAPTFPAPPSHVATSKNWSGYVARRGSYTAVRGSWTVPSVTTSAVVDVVTWIGIGGSTTGDLIQAGTEVRTFASAAPRYEAWIELLPGLMQPVPFAVHPGNLISVVVTAQGSDHWLIAFSNHSTGQNYQTTETYQSTHSSVEWVVERPSYGGALQELANFGTLVMTDASAERKGQTVSIAQAGGAPLNMVDATGQLIATVSGLANDGTSFQITRNE